MDRIKKLCEYLDPCESFADVGCDHGYCTGYMLKNGLCKTAVISDISAKCLAKAEKLLSGYIASGTVKPIVCNGLQKIDEDIEQVLIAGMGGEEIIRIFGSAFIPKNFVLQPMKNVTKVREFLLANSAEITVDEPFEIYGKFYYVLKGKRIGNLSKYSKAQLLYGKDLKSGKVKAYIKYDLIKKQSYLSRGLSDCDRKTIEDGIKFAEGVLNGEIE